MAIFPKRVPQFHHEKGNFIKKKMEDFYQQSHSSNMAFQAEASIDSRFEAGDQDIHKELHPEVPEAFSRQFNFNRIRRVVNVISGHQRRHRTSIQAIPIEAGDQQTADQYSKILTHIDRTQSVSETLSDGFQDSLITGLNMLHVWIDYREDPLSGSINVDSCPYNSFLIDPFFRKKDLSDCRGVWRRSYMSKAQLRVTLPGRKKELDELSGLSSPEKFSYMPEVLNMPTDDLYSYDEYFYPATRLQTLILDMETRESMEYKRGRVSKEDPEFMEFMRLHPDLATADRDISTIRRAIMVNGTMLYDDENPLGIDEYPFIPILGYFKPSLSSQAQRIQGVVRGLRDAQYLFNRRKATIEDILSSQVNSGWVYKESSLVNKDDIFMTGQGKGIALKSTAQMTDLSRIQSAQVSQAMFMSEENNAKEVMEIAGANEELLGTASDDKAGILAKLRVGAGLTTLQPLFDNLEHAQSRLGLIMLKAIQANYSVGKVRNIIEDKPAPQFYDKAFGKYSVAIVEGFDTTTQKQAGFAQLLQLRELGVNIPDHDLIEAATLQNKSKLMESIQQANAKQDELEAKKAEQELRMQESQTNLVNAKVESDLSLAKERDSRVFSNIGLMGDRVLEAEKDKTQSLLNLVKALGEIDSIDLANLEKLLQLQGVVDAQADRGRKVEGIGSAIVGGATKDVPNVPTMKSMELTAGAPMGVPGGTFGQGEQ